MTKTKTPKSKTKGRIKAKKPTTKAKKRTTKPKKRPLAASNELLIVQSKFKDAIRAQDMNVSSDAIEGANQIFQWYVDQAVKKAKANGRKTVKNYDFVAL